VKSVQLKVSKEEISGRATFMTTYDLLKSAINNPEQGGFNVDEMMKRLRILEELEKHKEKFSIKEGEFTDDKLALEEKLELEDSDFDKLKELFGQVKWGVVSRFIIDLHNELKNAHSYKAA
jgi:hypothetical protein